VSIAEFIPNITQKNFMKGYLQSKYSVRQHTLLDFTLHINA